MKTSRRFGENNTSFLGKEPNNGSKPREIQHTSCINISIKRIFQAQKPRRCAENKRKVWEKQRKSKGDIAKQKRHLSPICLKKVYWSDQIDVFNPLKDQKVKTNWYVGSHLFLSSTARCVIKQRLAQSTLHKANSKAHLYFAHRKAALHRLTQRKGRTFARHIVIYPHFLWRKGSHWCSLACFSASGLC